MGWYGSSRRDSLTTKIFRSERQLVDGKKVKEVYSNNELVHVWASGNVPRGVSPTMFFDKGVIYSFGHHYKAAKIYGDYVLINVDRYSSTTGKHLWAIERAVNHKKVISVPNVDVIVDHAENVEYLENEIYKSMMITFTQSKGWSSHEAFINGVDNLNTYLKMFNLPGMIDTQSDDYIVTVENLWASYDAREARATKKRETREANLKIKYQREQSDLDWKYRVSLEQWLKDQISDQELKRLSQRKVVKGVCFGHETYHYLTAKIPDSLVEQVTAKKHAKNAEHIKAWKDGKNSLPWEVRNSLDFAILRVVEDTVETSQGANVPLSHALRLLTLIEQKKARKGERVGHYTLETVAGLDDVPPVVTIGCHKILLSEAQSVLAPYRLSLVREG